MLINPRLALIFPVVFVLLVLSLSFFQANGGGTADPVSAGAGESILGELRVWHPITIQFSGPSAGELDDDPNPFLDYRLQVTFTGPEGQIYEVPGFFAGDGQGGGSGNVWQVIFTPDAPGDWSYTASFRSGPDVAVDLNASAGTAVSFDGAAGSFTVLGRNCQSPGFLEWGRLQYADNHYLKFADGSYWIKGGTDSPENFLGYHGFDNTVDQGGNVPNFLHAYVPHVSHWNPGDPNFVSADTGADAKGIIGALNYLSSKHVNSIYFLPMNLGGDGQETYPFVGAAKNTFNKTHYDVSKLYQWQIVLDHAQRQGIAVQMVLAETEPANYEWLDNGGFGVERKLFFREMIARYGFLLGLKWNLSEENRFPVETLRQFADYIQALDWADHPIGAHTYLDMAGSTQYSYNDMLGDSRFTATSIQYKWETANDFVEVWRTKSAAAGRPWILDMDENNDNLTSSNEASLRKRVLYAVYFSGGNIEWYAGYWDLPLGGDLRMEDFSTRQQMWDYMWYARKFMQDYLPFWEMAPADHLLTGESSTFNGGQVFAKPGQIYAIYLPEATPSGALDLSGAPGTFRQRWYNPRTGEFEGTAVSITGGGSVNLGSTPRDAAEDWVILLERTSPATAVVGPSGTDPHQTFLPLVSFQCAYQE